MKTSVSFCSGAGLADVGLIAAGYTPVGAYEIEPAIAEVYATNIGAHVHVGDLCSANFRRHEKPELLWASPSCKNASIANAKGGETAQDKAVAEAICRALREWTPEQFILENVALYGSFVSFALIVATLEALGYWTRAQVFNMASWGVPQTRVRLILRATRGDLATHGQTALFGGGKLPELTHKEPWRGWYEAIEDLVPELPESQFAEWQFARLGDFPKSHFMTEGNCNRSRVAHAIRAEKPMFTVQAHHGRRPSHLPCAFIVNGTPNDYGASLTSRRDGEPMFTVTAGTGSRRQVRAFIVEGSAAGVDNPFSMPVREQDEPVFTVRARQNNPRAWLETGRMVKMIPRALARFQSVPDSFELPEGSAKFLDGKRHNLAATVIGNAVPPLFAEKLVRKHCGLEVKI